MSFVFPPTVKTFHIKEGQYTMIHQLIDTIPIGWGGQKKSKNQ